MPTPTSAGKKDNNRAQAAPTTPKAGIKHIPATRKEKELDALSKVFRRSLPVAFKK
jgi:hypothetical protein